MCGRAIPEPWKNQDIKSEPPGITKIPVGVVISLWFCKVNIVLIFSDSSSVILIYSVFIYMVLYILKLLCTHNYRIIMCSLLFYRFTLLGHNWSLTVLICPVRFTVFPIYSLCVSFHCLFFWSIFLKVISLSEILQNCWRHKPEMSKFVKVYQTKVLKLLIEISQNYGHHNWRCLLNKGGGNKKNEGIWQNDIMAT